MDYLTDFTNILSMFVFYLVIFSIIVYIGIVIIVFLTLTNNIYFFRKKEPIFPFFTDRKEFINSENNRMVYWVSKRKNHKNWAVFLHYYSGSSEDMVTRSEPYLKAGFSLLFVDARNHGSSSLSSSSTIYYYGLDVLEILEYEGIESFHIHGVSFGAYAALIICKIIRDTKMDLKVNAIVIEAISRDLKNILWYLLDYTPFPNILFGWIPKLLYFHWRHFEWERYNPDNILKEIYHIPVFLIQGEKDRLYPYQIHFLYLKSIILEQFRSKNSKTWLVKDYPHLGMDTHPQYANRITDFLSSA